jgi:hypothetical protein
MTAGQVLQNQLQTEKVLSNDRSLEHVALNLQPAQQA